MSADNTGAPRELTANCAFCGAHTQLHLSGVPLCVACDSMDERLLRDKVQEFINDGETKAQTS